MQYPLLLLCNRFPVAFFLLMEPGEYFPLWKLLVIDTVIISDAPLNNPTCRLAEGSCSALECDNIVREGMPYFAIQFATTREASTCIVWVNAQEVPQFHRDALRIPKIGLSRLGSMHG